MTVSNQPARVAILADDLIWATRLDAAVRKGGASPIRTSSTDQLRRLLAVEDPPAAVLVDLNGRGYDGVEAVRLAAAGGQPVFGVGQHENLALRRQALDAGARRVFSYNKLFRDGPQVVARLLDGRS